MLSCAQQDLARGLKRWEHTLPSWNSHGAALIRWQGKNAGSMAGILAGHVSIGDVFGGLMWGRPCRAGGQLALALLTVALLAVGVAGCAATLALDRVVVAYDTTTTNSVAQQLLLNIARARHN